MCLGFLQHSQVLSACGCLHSFPALLPWSLITRFTSQTPCHPCCLSQPCEDSDRSLRGAREAWVLLVLTCCCHTEARLLEFLFHLPVLSVSKRQQLLSDSPHLHLLLLLNFSLSLPCRWDCARGLYVLFLQSQKSCFDIEFSPTGTSTGLLPSTNSLSFPYTSPEYSVHLSIYSSISWNDVWFLFSIISLRNVHIIELKVSNLHECECSDLNAYGREVLTILSFCSERLPESSTEEDS